jgi:hypothetical protein
MSARLRSISARASLDQREGFGIAPLLMREHPGIMQRTRMIGESLEYSAVDFLSVGELLVLLQKNRERHRLLERQLTRR